MLLDGDTHIGIATFAQRIGQSSRKWDDVSIYTYIFLIYELFSDVEYEQGSEQQFLVPLVSPFSDKVQFWLKPFDRRGCLSNLRFDCFAIIKPFSQTFSIVFAFTLATTPNSSGCSLCPYTISTQHVRDPSVWNAIVVSGFNRNSSLTVTDALGRFSVSTTADCIVKLRPWPDSEKQF